MVKKISSFILAALMLIVAAGCEKKEPSEEEKTNIVVVIDISDSMNQTDPGGGETYFTSTLLTAFNANLGLSFKSADNEILNNTYFGVVTYGLDAKKNLSLSSLGEMSDDDYVEAFKKINKIEYSDKSGTNFYAGMEMAYKMCEANPAGKNLIYVLSDGQFYPGKLPGDDGYDKILNDCKEKYKKNILNNEKYTVNAISINTNPDSFGHDEDAFSVENLACHGGTAVTVENWEDFDDLAMEFLEEISGILNLEIDLGGEVFKAENGIAEFSLDNDYKTVQLWMFPAKSDSGKDKAKPPKIISIKTPDDEEEQSFENGMETGGFLGFNKCKISVSEDSDIAVKAIIENAPKGEWSIRLSEKSDVIVKQIRFNPFPWSIVLPIAVLCIILLILLLMWLFYIPPLRYRKKPIPGFLTMEKTDGLGNNITLYEEYPVYAIIKKGKFLSKGNLTLGALLSDKKFKNIVIKYRPDTQLDDAHLEIRGQDLTGTYHSFELYSDSANNYNLDENTGLTMTWSC